MSERNNSSSFFSRIECGLLLMAMIFLMLQGCCFHYLDRETGTEHVWGFGHMKVKVTEPSEGIQGVVKGVQTGGLSLGRLEEGFYLSIGLDYRQRLYILDKDTSVRLEWPDNDFCNIRLGSQFKDYQEQGGLK